MALAAGALATSEVGGLGGAAARVMHFSSRYGQVWFSQPSLIGALDGAAAVCSAAAALGADGAGALAGCCAIVGAPVARTSCVGVERSMPANTAHTAMTTTPA